MNPLKEQILEFLIENVGTYVSGEAICAQLGCTRAAVWKHMSALKEQGAQLEALPHKGYRLLSIPEFLSSAAVTHSMARRDYWKRIIILDQIDSTNSYIKRLAGEAPHGTAVIASRQTCGRGRLGRPWQSPPGGLYLSMLFRPETDASALPSMSLIFPVAVLDAIRDLSGLDCRIKWPNDIVYRGRKLCGILTESVCEFGGDAVCVAGVGVNVKAGAIDPELAPYAASIADFSDKPINLNMLAGAVLDKAAQYMEAPFDEVLGRYASNCVTLGRAVRVSRGNESFTGTAKSLGRDGTLTVELPDGGLKTLLSGEVSVRGVMGYV